MRYVQDTIGAGAGKIWEALNANKAEGQNVSGLEKATGLKKDDILLALGWLFCEGKVISSKAGRGVKFYLK